MNCDEIAPLLLEYAEGDLPEEQAAAVRAHARGCGACAGRIRQTRDMIGALSAARGIDSSTDHAPSAPPAAAGATTQNDPTIGLDATAYLRATVSAGRADRGDGGAPGAVRSASNAGFASHFLGGRIGDFEILGELGRGGMGIVFRARQVTLNRVVALKVLSPALLASPKAAIRFQKEARAAGRLHHTNIVPIYAQGEHDGCLYYAMELIEGQALSEILHNDPVALGMAGPAAPTSDSIAASADGSLSVSRTAIRAGATFRRTRDYKRIARLIAEVAEALHHAHEEGIVHRDIKPQNLMLGQDDKLHITDFGLARLLDEPGLTLSTEMVGTPAYASPEQLSGGRALDRRTDIFSLGVTLFEMLTLQRPFGGTTVDHVIHSILHREPPSPRRIDRHIPLDLETICLRALEKEPAARFRSAAEMAADLRRYSLDFPIASRRISILGRAVRWVRRKPAKATAIGIAILALPLVPIIGVLAKSKANSVYDDGLNVVLTDYNDGARAKEIIDSVWWPGGDERTRRLTLAVSNIKNQSADTLEIVGQYLAAHPRDRDFLYLAAWKCRRDEHWRQMQEYLSRGDALGAEGVPADASGWFFRGQAIFPMSPEAAIESYDEAIRARSNFTQAMIMQGRAATHLMYAFGDETHYGTAKMSLMSAIKLEPHNPRAAYFLAYSHIWAAETARSHGDAAEADRRFDAALDAARAAQRATESDPRTAKDPRGFNVEAHVYEHMGHYAEALVAWEHMPTVDRQHNRDLYDERFAYPMRLHAWLGHFDKAEELRRGRYAAHSASHGTTSQTPIEARDAVDGAWYEALLATGRSPDRIAAALDGGTKAAGRSAELLLLIESADRVTGGPLTNRVTSDMDYETNLSRDWSAAWTRALAEYWRGARTWDELMAVADAEAKQTPIVGSLKAELRRRQMLLAGAWFYRGMAELAAGKREDAKQALEAAWRLNDDENYCFRARFVHGMLESHADWPGR